MAFPNDPWDNLSDQQRQLFGEIQGTDYFESGWEETTAQTLYAAGFGFTADEYESMGIDENTVYAARQEFFDFMQLNENDFPWDEWRQAMGYE